MSTSLAHSQTSRLARRPFIVAVVVVYALSFVSQMLLSAPVTGRLSVVPFVLVQIVLIAVWIVLHRRRLHDAGRPGGIAIGIAMIYALEMVLLTLLIWIVSAPAGTSNFADEGAGVFHLFAFLYLLGVLSGDSNLGALQIWLMGFAVVMFLPILIAMCFSVWAATRPGQSSPP
jgi:uncharacterized membrane protein YhaH (DUF805 family)